MSHTSRLLLLMLMCGWLGTAHGTHSCPHHHHHHHHYHDDEHEHDEHIDSSHDEHEHDDGFLRSNWYASISTAPEGEAEQGQSKKTIEKPLIFRAANGISYLTPFNFYEALNSVRVAIVFFYTQNSDLCESAYADFVAAVDGYAALCGRGKPTEDNSSAISSSSERFPHLLLPCDGSILGGDPSNERVLFGQMDVTLVEVGGGHDDDGDDGLNEREAILNVRSQFGPNRTTMEDFPTAVVMWWREEPNSGGIDVVKRLVIRGFNGQMKPQRLRDVVEHVSRHQTMPLVSDSDASPSSSTFDDGILVL